MSLSAPEFDVGLASPEADDQILDTLAALRGLLWADFGSFADPAVRDAVATFGNRIQAFASVRRHAVEEVAAPLVDAPDHLENLCEHLCAAHLEPLGVHCAVRADPGRLPRDVWRGLRLIIAELVGDAAKHVFTGLNRGCVWVTFRRIDRGWVCQVADNGADPRGEHMGPGGMLVRSLARSLGADLRVRSDQHGVSVTLTLPELAAPLPASRASA
jgi:two-component sensor histidine kinase